MEDEEEEEEEDELPMGYKEHSAHGARDAAGPSEDVEPPEDGPDGGDLFDDGTGPTEPNEHGAKVLPEEDGTGEDALYPEETTVEPIGHAGSEGDEIIDEPGMTERNDFAVDGAPEEVLTPTDEEGDGEIKSAGHGPKHRPGARHAVGHTTEEGSVKLALTTHKNFRAS